MGFDLGSHFLQMLNDRTLDCSTEIGVLICDDTCLVSDAIVHVLTRLVKKEDQHSINDGPAIHLPQGTDSQT